ncbi:MAG: T9SS type A sorting domain-containing protein [Bacteroidota bacterium]
MKKNILLSTLAIALTIGAGFEAQAQYDTLRNLNEGATLYRFPVKKQAAEVSNDVAPEWGTITGYNSYGDEAFAEKYYINGRAKVFGIMAYHYGKKGSTRNRISYKILSSGRNKLPNKELGSVSVPISNLKVSGAPTITSFEGPVMVSDSFFVSFDMGNYSSRDLKGDTIGLYVGSGRADEAAAGTMAYGRTAVRWAGDQANGNNWRDMYSESGTKIAAHLALFPIVAFDITGSISPKITNGALTLRPNYLNTRGSATVLNYNIKKAEKVTISVFNSRGKKIREYQKGAQPKGDYLDELPLKGLKSGTYVYAIQAGASGLAGKFDVGK